MITIKTARNAIPTASFEITIRVGSGRSQIVASRRFAHRLLEQDQIQHHKRTTKDSPFDEYEFIPPPPPDISLGFHLHRRSESDNLDLPYATDPTFVERERLLNPGE
jgi:hypothetical protein